MEITTLSELKEVLTGDLYYDTAMRTLYATDASAYREMPTAVAIPRTKEDLITLVTYANKNGKSLIPRTAGTSLAGQVVGSGIVVDVSKHFNQILEVNKEENWVRLQPGVVRNVLNAHLKPYELFYGPETSTASRAMIGGMVGNNSCGSNSVVYGSAREHLLEVNAILSDGSEAVFKTTSLEEFEEKCQGETLEAKIYREVREILDVKGNQDEIRKEFPKPSIPRRNTGYAIDLLLETAPFTEGKEDFNFCKLIAGSEGTLAFITELKINVGEMPPKEKALICVHTKSVDEALRANLIALKYKPQACELMDHYVLECTKENIEQRQNRFFVEGDPQAILIVDISAENREQVDVTAREMEAEMRANNMGYHFSMVHGATDCAKVWKLRSAGLGLLANIPGDATAVAVIEDTAVDVNDLPEFIRDFNVILDENDMYCVHYAHAGSGELHLRPIIDLKTEKGNKEFRKIAEEIATLVKRYKGSLSGEHGDGRLRGEFIQFMIGDQNYKIIQRIKQIWDPKNIFNANKIVDTPPMNTSLRYMPNQDTPDFDTIYNFDKNQGILRAAELCNGSADCRKTPVTGGTMCPSYMATGNERETTRARANILREFLTHSKKKNRFDHKEIKEVMDLCLSCKGCKSECPSNVDIAKLKGEFLQHYYDANGVPSRARMIADFPKMGGMVSNFPSLYNFAVTNKFTSKIIKGVTGFAQERPMPVMHKTTVKKWFKKHDKPNFTPKKKVLFFCDEFTDYNDTPIGITTVKLLEKLGYEVSIPLHIESGRTYLSKGLIREAQEVAIRNVDLLKDVVSEQTPIIGIEPSAILTLRDEYLDLVPKSKLKDAQQVANHTYYIDEFIANEIDAGNITSDLFTEEKQLVKVHGHCHQKSLSSLTFTKKMLSLPKNYDVHMINSGCCGMAGSFGYEKEHYELSMQVGELVLFPTVRKQPAEVIIAAPGTSCRHQIKDGTGREAIHTVEVLYEALK